MMIEIDASLLLEAPEAGLPPEETIFGRSKAMAEVQKEIEGMAFADVPLLLRGGSGTGKEVLARHIHRRQFGPNIPFIRINLLKLRATTLEEVMSRMQEELITRPTDPHDHENQKRNSCTLFLDEVADLNWDWQCKLKQFIQLDALKPFGGGEEDICRVRFICATSRPLERDVEANRFRQDLFYCINVVSICLPALGERRKDIPGLVAYFLKTYRNKFNRDTPEPSRQTIEHLQRRAWPGNIRELENLIKRYVLKGSESIFHEEVEAASLPGVLSPARNEIVSLKTMTRKAARDLERKMILKVLGEKHGNRTQAARALKISYRALLYKLKEAGVPRRWHTQGEEQAEINFEPLIHRTRVLSEEAVM